MPLWVGPMNTHLNGHKELTAHNEIVTVKPKGDVYIPLSNGNNAAVEVLVKEGDKVKVGSLLAKRSVPFIVPIYSSVSGTVGPVKSMMHAVLRPCDHLVIHDDGKDTGFQAFGF